MLLLHHFLLLSCWTPLLLSQPVNPVLPRGKSVHQTNNNGPSHGPAQTLSLLQKASIGLTAVATPLLLVVAKQRHALTKHINKHETANLQKEADRTVNSEPIEDTKALSAVVHKAKSAAVNQYPWTFMDYLKDCMVRNRHLSKFDWVPEYHASNAMSAFYLSGKPPEDAGQAKQFEHLIDICLDPARQKTEEIKKQIGARRIKPIREPEPDWNVDTAGSTDESRTDAGGLSFQNGLDKLNRRVGAVGKVDHRGAFGSVGSTLSGARLGPALLP
ncbi:MAG: hypothetical protein M1816_003961 [Peltula sp. TS41687]|nr:MAG: hypothetical protein M1816_003961 [Peltula sp. TS41687]